MASAGLVGREGELELLVEAMSAPPPPALVMVEGEAGIGKSRLVDEATLHPGVVGRHVLVGHCHRLRDPFLLGPLVEAVRDAGGRTPSRPLSPVVGALRPLVPELAHLLPEQPAPVGDRRAERHRVFRALRELLGAFGPAVCVLEDLHWADDGTLEFLEFLLSKPAEDLAVVLTYRGEDLPRASRLLGLPGLCKGSLTATVRLAPLEVEEVRTLTCAFLETDAVSDELARHLHERTAGIPFALEEVLRLLQDRGTVRLGEVGRSPADLDQLGVPPGVRQALRDRMEPLGDDAKLMLRAAAVLGVPASEQVLRRTAAVASRRAARGLTEALGCALMRERANGSYSFRHALAAQGVYDEIAGPERRRLHLQAAKALESEPEPRPLALLAHHFREADRPAQWGRYAEAAAEVASAAGDDRTAARLLEQALGAAELPRAARVRMAVKLGSAAVYSDHPRTAIGLLERILDEEQMAVGVRGELRLCLARLRLNAGDDASWHDEMARAVAELQRRPKLAARAMVNLSWPMLRAGRVEDDLAWLPKAAEAAERADDPVTRTMIHSQRAAILLVVGDPAGWGALEDIPAEGGSVEAKLELLRGYHSLAVVTLGLGHHRRAGSFLAEVARLGRELDHVFWEPWSAGAKVSLDWRTGRWDELESRARELTESKAGRPVLAVGSELVLASLLFARGRVDEAEQSLEAVLQRAHARRWMTARVAASAWLARIRLFQEDAGAARQAAGLGLETVRRKGVWVWAREVAPVAVQALLACGDRSGARELSRELASGLRGRDAPAAHAASCVCNGAVAEAEGRLDAAARFFARADSMCSEMPCPYEAAQARERQARCLLAQDDDDGAALLLSALEVFDGLQASRDVRRVRQELKAQGIKLPSPWRGGRRAYGDELSPREAEVAHLAGLGRKNREIADLLFISTRTVEDHVASALRKLGADSRQALASVGKQPKALAKFRSSTD